MSPVEAFNPMSTSMAPAPAGTYSQAIRAGNLIFVSGQTPRLPDGTRLNDAPFSDQARQALTNLSHIAAAAGTELSRAASVTIYLRDIEDRFLFDDVWSEFVSEPYPARAIVQSDLPGFAIEVSAILVCITGDQEYSDQPADS